VKAAWVVPRWSPDVRGGAETAARMVAERLAALPGWEVEVFTSRAVDHFTWANTLPEGTETLNGVEVHRFTCSGVRFDDDPAFAARVIHYPRSASMDEARRWVAMQGPTSADLVDAIAGSDADVVTFTPYLFAPAVQGLPRVAARSVLAAAAHDEPLLHLAVYRELFGAAASFVYYTPEERTLVERRFEVAHRPHAILGLGIETPAALPGAAALPDDLGDTPYVVSLGRVEEGKGSRMLARFFEEYKRRRPGPLKLVLVGPVTQAERYTHDDVVLTGAVDEATKWALLAHARAFVSPSPYESFSLVLMEAWWAGLPALVNGRCAVTRGHAARSGGGVWFEGYASFEAALDRLLGDEAVAARMAQCGKAYVEEHYSWPRLVDAYRTFYESRA